MGRVYSYLRFSDPKQAAGGSIDRQQAYAARWAADNGMVLDETLSLRDEGLSAYHQRHVKNGALGTFLEAVHTGRVPAGSVLVVEGLDRLSRAEPLLAQSQLAAIVNAGLAVVTASDGRVYSRESLKANPMDLIYSLLVMIRAHEESDTKSRRVSAALTRLAEKWQAGTYRGRITVGRDPAWVEWNGSGWAIKEPEATVVRETVRLFTLGLGAAMIRPRLVAAGLIAESDKTYLQPHRLARSAALIGQKTFTAGGKEWVLDGYYPPLLTITEWDRLQSCMNGRARTKVVSAYTEIISGFNLVKCGYCGASMQAQNMMTKLKEGETQLADPYRRIRCTRRGTATYTGETCPIGGSAPLRPIEAAIMAFCSDLLNLSSLAAPDQTEAKRNELATANEALRTAEKQLARLLDAMLASDKPPRSWEQKAHALEAQVDQLKAQAKLLESELAVASTGKGSGANEEFARLAGGVAAMDDEARLKARQLIAESFDTIVVWSRGIRPPSAEYDRSWKLRRQQHREFVDLALIGKGGASRMLRIDQAGQWVAADDIQGAA